MADINVRVPGCDDDDCEGERGERGKRGHRGERGHDGPTGPTGATGPSGDPFAATFPPFPLNGGCDPVTQTIFANASGSDATGDGTAATPFRTFQRAIRQVPHIILPGHKFIVDITNLGVEILPSGYQLPEIHAPTPFYGGSTAGVPLPFVMDMPLNIRAFPQLASGFPAADMVITAADIASIVTNPDTGLVTINLLVARASWGIDLLRGLILASDYNAASQGPIYTNTTTSISLASGTGFTAPVGAQQLRISEQSATLQTSLCPNPPPVANPPSQWGMIAFDLGAVAFQGIKFTLPGAPAGTVALAIFNTAVPDVELCDVAGLGVFGSAGRRQHGSPPGTAIATVFASTIRNTLLLVGCAAFDTNRSLFADVATIDVESTNLVQMVRTVWDATLASIKAFQPAIPGILGSVSNWQFSRVLIRNSVGADVIANGAVSCGPGQWTFDRTKINGSAGDAIKSTDGSTYIKMVRVTGGTGGAGDPVNAGFGVNIHDGTYARVLDDATLVTGAAGDMKVGTLPVRTWVNFRTVDPIKNQYDLTTPFELNVASGLFTPAGETTTGAGTGGRSGTRLFQRP